MHHIIVSECIDPFVEVIPGTSGKRFVEAGLDLSFPKQFDRANGYLVAITIGISEAHAIPALIQHYYVLAIFISAGLKFHKNCYDRGEVEKIL
jgi:hypothetical protein